MFATDVEILNISLEGIALSANRRLEIGRQYNLKLEYGDENITLNGVVVWSVLSELSKGPYNEMVPVYKAGMKFKNVLSERMSELIEFIDKSKQIVGHRLTIRFDVTSPERAVLNGPHNYRVKKVSQRGMLIETDMPLEVESRLPMEVFLYESTPVKFVGRVASCKEILNEVPKHYDIGIEFTEMSKEDEELFKEFINSL